MASSLTHLSPNGDQAASTQASWVRHDGLRTCDKKTSRTQAILAVKAKGNIKAAQAYGRMHKGEKGRMLGADYDLAGAKFELPVEGSYVAEFHSAAPRSRRGRGARVYQRLAGADSDDERADGGLRCSVAIEFV